MKLVNRDLTSEKEGVPGYLAHPERKEPGPGLYERHTISRRQEDR